MLRCVLRKTQVGFSMGLVVDAASFVPMLVFLVGRYLCLCCKFEELIGSSGPTEFDRADLNTLGTVTAKICKVRLGSSAS